MKKILFSLFALFITSMAFAYDVEIDGIYYDIAPLGYGQVYAAVCNDGNISDGAGYSQTEIVIPKKISWNGVEYSVTRILSEAFYGCKNLTKITILNSLNIDDNAFYGCESLTTIVWDGEDFSTSGLPNSVESIILGNNVREISTFSGLDRLTSIKIPINVTRIYYKAFENAKNITSIEWNVREIYSIYGYRDGDNMHTSILPKSVERIIFGDSVETIFPYLCSDLVNLTSVTMSNSISTIGAGAFSNCIALTSITIPENKSLWEICKYTFLNCSSLTSIIIPKNVIKVSEHAFSNCTALASITIPYTTSTIGDVFENCKSIMTVNLIVDSIEDCCRYGCCNFAESKFETVSIHLIMNDKEITNLVIPESVTTIRNQAFTNCSNIISVTIPKSVTSIEWNAFYKCTGLTSVYISDIAAWCNVDFADNPLEYAQNLYLNGEKVRDLVIPEGVNIVKGSTFYNCIGLTSVMIPNSITSIGSFAFYGCTGLDTIMSFAIEPPVISNLAFDNYDCFLLVPKGALGAYKDHEIWGKFKNIKEIKEKYTITTSVNDETMGAVSEGGVYEEDSEITLMATANEGYCFMQWSDGNAENPRVITVTKDFTYIANFAKTFVISTSVNDEIMGTVLGAGEYGEGSEVVLKAIANDGYRFVEWSDGNTENPRVITVTKDFTYIANFAKTFVVSTSVNDEIMGTVLGAGEYGEGSEVVLKAIANDGYRFVEWFDGNMENPRTIVVTEDVNLMAMFELEGTPVDNVEKSSVQVYVRDGEVYVEGINEDYQIFDAFGRLVYIGCESVLSLPRGVYVVVIGNEVQKIVL